MIEKIENLLELGGTKKDIYFLIISGISLILSMTHILGDSFEFAWIAIILCGLPIIIEAVIGLVTKFDIKADVLVSLALIAAIIIGEYFAAGEVAFIMQLGALLEDITVAKARTGIEKLVKLTPQTARIINDNKEEIIPAEKVQVGQIIRVLPGETIPVDGEIIKGETSINQAVITGESLPVDKGIGDEVSSGTVNQFGAFEMIATKVGEDSSIQRMIRLVQSADASKAKIVNLTDRWATWIVVIALTSAVLTWIVTGEIIRAVTILVVFCPCALVLATPTAIMAGIGNATNHGFLVREGDALERLSQINKIMFDKTGTLTYGKLKVNKIISLDKNFSEENLYEISASAEQFSEHPIGKAITESYRNQNKKTLETKDFKMIAGQGVICRIKSMSVLLGNKKLMENNNILISQDHKSLSSKYEKIGNIVIYISIENEIKGIIVLSDIVREESQKIIKYLDTENIDTMLLSGDNIQVVEHISEITGIKNYKANCSPEDKLNIINGYQKQNKNICMIGDGINDAPALKKANVGIAMGGIGSDIAVDAADIVIIDDEIKNLPHLLELSKKMMKTIKLNLSFSLILNFVAIILAITGVLDPVVGALVHNTGSVLVIVNSIFLLRWR